MYGINVIYLKKILTQTLRSLKNTEFLAQSTWENKFWSSTLHINSNKSTSHWLYVWFCNNPKSDACHSRSSTVCTKSLIIGLVFNVAVEGAEPVAPWDCVDCSPKLKAFGLGVVELAAQSLLSRPGLRLCRWLPAEMFGWEDGAISWCWPAPLPACVVTKPAATAAGDGLESGEEVRLETWGICISCLICRKGVTAEG